MRADESSWHFNLDTADLEELDRELSRLSDENIPLESITRAGLHLPHLSERCKSWQSELTHGRGVM
jgi:hypothetical protein